jgi:hypothetical protein
MQWLAFDGCYFKTACAMMRKPLLLFSILAVHVTYAQLSPRKNLHFRAGAEVRVTAFEMQFKDANPGSSHMAYVPFEGDYLSGPAFLYSIEKEFSQNWFLVFNQQLRLEKLEGSNMGIIIKTGSKNMLVTDLGLDLLKGFFAGKSLIKTGLGIGIGGIGSHYSITTYSFDNNGMPMIGLREGNYTYSFASANLAWQKGKFQANLKLNYAWKFPGVAFKSFLQPQIGIQYRLFSF